MAKPELRRFGSWLRDDRMQPMRSIDLRKWWRRLLWPRWTWWLVVLYAPFMLAGIYVLIVAAILEINMIRLGYPNPKDYFRATDISVLEHGVAR